MPHILKPCVLLHIFSSLADDFSTDLPVNEPFFEHCRCLSQLKRPIKASWMWFCGAIVSLLAKGIDTSLISVWIERQGQAPFSKNISAMRRWCNFSNYLGITIIYIWESFQSHCAPTWDELSTIKPFCFSLWALISIIFTSGESVCLCLTLSPRPWSPCHKFPALACYQGFQSVSRGQSLEGFFVSPTVYISRHYSLRWIVKLSLYVSWTASLNQLWAF